MRVRATKTVEYAISVSEQREYDPDDGTGPGWYAWVGTPGDQSDWVVGPFKTAKAPGDQSDWVVGPFKTAKAARVGACERLRRMGYTVEKA